MLVFGGGKKTAIFQNVELL